MRKIVFFSAAVWLFFLSCKKPKDGHYKADFTDKSGYRTSKEILIDRKKSSISISSFNPGNYALRAELPVDGDKVSGSLWDGYASPGNRSEEEYKLNGTCGKKSISGTYTLIKISSSGGAPSQTETSEGTFQISWISG